MPLRLAARLEDVQVLAWQNRAARRRGRFPFRRLRVPKVKPARAIVPAPPARVRRCDPTLSISPWSCDAWQRKFLTQGGAERNTEKYLCFPSIVSNRDVIAYQRYAGRYDWSKQCSTFGVTQLSSDFVAIKFLSSSDLI